jgi:hypothetical protein
MEVSKCYTVVALHPESWHLHIDVLSERKVRLPGMVVQVCNASTQKAEAGES